MDWRAVRHVILTVGRDAPPVWYYEVVRYMKDIPRMMSKITPSATRWLWVLEFHRGGYPHWHVIVEKGRGMIGHDRIEAAWRHGHVWESPITDRRHWGKIIGYHEKSGYIGGDTKGHQIELPDYLMDRSRVRKFGRKQHRGGDNAPRERPVGDRGRTQRAKSESYRQRFSQCGEGARVRVGSQWSYSRADACIINGLAERYLGERVQGEYECEAEYAADVVSQAEAWTDSTE